jgi:hypothetical protein
LALANRTTELRLGSSVTDWTEFDGTMLDAYEATMESPEGTAFVTREGHLYSMASAIRTVERTIERTTEQA